jgi:hypothetical protein
MSHYGNFAVDLAAKVVREDYEHNTASPQLPASAYVLLEELDRVLKASPAGMQTLPQFVEWFRTDLVYKAPEDWPANISWFLDTLVQRFGGNQ